MSNFGSINDLLSPEPQKAPPLNVSSDETDEKFGKKMDEIKRKELELKAIRYASQVGMPHIDLTKFPVTHEALKQISREQAEGLGVICFYASSDEIRLGALDPKTPEVEALYRELIEQKHVGGGLYVISQVSFDRVMKLYDTMPNVKPVTKDISIKAEDLEKVQADVNDFRSVEALLKKSSTTDLITILLGASLKVDSSDVHVEAEETRIVVRFRLDGILHDVAELPKELFQKLLSRIKLVSSLKINVTDKPQDGRFTIKLPTGDVDVRVSTIPTVFGESIVMRLLIQNEEGISLESLGMSERDLKMLREEIARPNGMIVTTGPTGSGKTTTLYAILKILNQPGVKIITLEDPVEYRMEGVNQSQIDHTKDYTFAKGLRSILRQDPDIVMVGEIRDLETSDIAIQAALTGHLMLSTIHTNSAAGAVPRFLSMGSQPFLLAPALNCLMGQRLVRRVCVECKVAISVEELDEHTQKRLHEQIAGLPADSAKELQNQTLTFYASKGCDKCNGIGYKGRIGIYEIFVVRDEIEQAILSGNVSEHAILEIARTQGMTTMVQDGILKAVQGITTLDEVFRVID
jgi:type II secretory ATPase GspE/PulE/Tfp pilus assembly ATPase PilB-like protein